MRWAKAALVGGLMLVIAAFAVGVEHRSSTRVDGDTRDCGSAVSASWLVSGTPDLVSARAAATADERRTGAECRPVLRQSRILLLTTMGAGGLLTVTGGTAVRRRVEITTDRSLVRV